VAAPDSAALVDPVDSSAFVDGEPPQATLAAGRASNPIRRVRMSLPMPSFIFVRIFMTLFLFLVLRQDVARAAV
jgi:hypothetical protein